jgi:hypothetical protein
LCVGCGASREESFAPENEDRYDATILKCFKCATREHKSHILQTSAREPDALPPLGVYIAVTGPTDE